MYMEKVQTTGENKHTCTPIDIMQRSYVCCMSMTVYHLLLGLRCRLNRKYYKGISLTGFEDNNCFVWPEDEYVARRRRLKTHIRRGSNKPAVVRGHSL